MDIHVWHAVPDKYVLPLEIPRAQWLWSTLTKSYCLSAPSCRRRGMWLRPYSGPSSRSLAARRSTSPKTRDLLSLMQMNLKTWWQKSSSSDASLIVVPWTNGWQCTHESISTIHSLIMPTNKSYFPVKKTNSYCFISSIFFHFIIWWQVYSVLLWCLKMNICQNKRHNDFWENRTHSFTCSMPCYHP